MQSNISKGDTITINNTKLSMEELINRIDDLSENTNPYSVSKEIEEIKSLFYSKLKMEQKEEKTQTEEQILELVEQPEETESIEVKKTLHPLELKFKQSFSNYKKIKFEYKSYYYH